LPPNTITAFFPKTSIRRRRPVQTAPHNPGKILRENVFLQKTAARMNDSHQIGRGEDPVTRGKILAAQNIIR
jgi:hypothetical protein